MGAHRRASLIARLAGNTVVRVAAFYLLLGGGVALLWQYLHARTGNPVLRDAVDTIFGSDSTAEPVALGRRASRVAAVEPTTRGALALDAFFAMVSGALLAFPVAWIYTLTRQKRGYRQSVVQTLVLLPAVVAGVVMLVKHSLALAFSLAGIVAAVRFRNTLEDAKDAVYIFLATGLGLAAGVEPAVAFVFSAVFNLLMLLLWWADFGRTPARLEGRMAERRMAQAVAKANRTGQFVARLDKELLTGLSPEQLEALADRAWRRRRRQAPDQSVPHRARAERLLRVHTTDVESTRQAIEPVLDEHLKRWRLGGVVHEDGGMHIVEYAVLLRKSTPADVVRALLRDHGTPHVANTEIV